MSTEVLDTPSTEVEGEMAELEAAVKQFAEGRRSDACARCCAACCRRFAIAVPYKVLPHRGNGRRKPWHERVRMNWRDACEDTVFHAANFKCVPQFYGTKVLDDHRTRKERWKATVRRRDLVRREQYQQRRTKVGLWLTCIQRVDNHCGCYEQRPTACRNHLCASAEWQQKTPLEAGHAKYFPGVIKK